MTTQQTIAQTILSQLGGNKFLVMTGAKDLLAGSNSLQFRLPKMGTNKINTVRITLLRDDSYRIEFWKIRGISTTFIGCFDIMAEQLREVFEFNTGYFVSL
jgi:hypothetical protein